MIEYVKLGLLVMGFITPFAIWLIRLGSNQRALKQSLESQNKEIALRFQAVEQQMQTLPNSETVHNIEKALIKIDGNIKLLHNQITNIKDNQDSVEKALNRMEDKYDRGK